MRQAIDKPTNLPSRVGHSVDDIANGRATSDSDGSLAVVDGDTLEFTQINGQAIIERRQGGAVGVAPTHSKEGDVG